LYLIPSTHHFRPDQHVRSLHILLVHQNFPGQFRELAPAWVSRGMQISAVGSTSSRIPGVSHHPYHPAPGLNRGLALRRHLQRLAELDGLQPDLVIAHSGWGEALPIKAVWPHTPLVVYPELWGSPLALGVGFDPLQPALSADQLHSLRHHNRRTARALQQADAAVAPTAFQRNSFPPPWRERITLIHEGVDCKQHQPDPDASLLLPNGVQLRRGIPVITYVSRAFEPLRGLRSFLAALPPLLATNPELQVVMVGGDGKGYGPVADHPSGHLGAAFDQLRGQLDLRRLHRPGALPHAQLRRLLQLSSAHVYLTYPYALSWSVLEAMACGAPTVGNHSGPLDDVICDGHNGRLVDFNQPHQLSAALAELLADPEQQRRLGREARRTVEEHYRLDQAVERYEALFNRLVSHRSS